MKIKTKKQVNLPQLIEWAWDNQATENTYRSESITVTFSISGNPRIESEYTFLPKYETFTVEVEEEIDEDTVIPRLVTRNTSGGYNEWGNDCVNGFNLEYIKAIHILNDDLSLILIWTREKGLVE